MVPTWKEQKELFVSGLQGTTPQELIVICSTAVTGILCYQALASPWRNATASALAWEGLSFWIPIVLCQTVWLYPYGVAYMMAQILVTVVLRFSSVRSTSVSATDKRSTESLQHVTITIYRSCLLLLTLTAILAVDFNVFPRRWGKTETTGYSLMDLGAASFVVAAGIVSPRARPNRAVTHAAHDTLIPKSVRRMLPLLFMGSLRLITHKELEYQEHASEYGVHWNFFFTLAFLEPMVALLSGGATRRLSLVPPVLAMTVYQLALSTTGLQQWVQDAPRSCPRQLIGRPHATMLCEFWCANREGILGCLSYAALYLTSEWIAGRYFWNPSRDGISVKPLTFVVAMVFGLWVLCTTTLGIPVSRRTTNLPFCLWTLFVNLLQLAGIQWVMAWNQQCGGDAQAPIVLTAMNRNGLLMFVIANLLTGAVNLSINTLAASDGLAVAILVAYLGVVGLIAMGIDQVKKRLTSRRVSWAPTNERLKTD